MTAYYNEFNAYKAQWLRNLITLGVIADGVVDERDIRDVKPEELRPFTQVHLFAGIGGWSYAARLAGWPDDRPLWTASCPCQPFSASGRRDGFADERHLWPAADHHIAALRPDVVVGEQVASRDGLAWNDLVSSDLEGKGYAFGTVDLCGASIGSPQIRQRQFWLACSDTGQQRGGRGPAGESEQGSQPRPDLGGRGATERLVNGVSPRLEGHGGHGHGGDQPGWEHADTAGPVTSAGAARGLADATGGIHQPGGAQSGQWPVAEVHGRGVSVPGPTGPTDGFWRDADWLFCRDGKWRPVEPRTFPLADGLSVDMGLGCPSPFRQKPPSRQGLLMGYGDAIIAPLAAKFLEKVMEIVI